MKSHIDAGAGAYEGKRDGGFQFRLFHGLTPETETSPPRTPLVPERSDFLEGDAWYKRRWSTNLSTSYDLTYGRSDPTFIF
jgi:hypothetical protein